MISIIIPTFNSSKTLHDCLKSVINQSFTKFEIIVIDNNSQDDTIDLVNQFKKIDDRILLYNEKQQGIAFALNKGIKVAKYPLIARMDSDDIMLPFRLEKQLEFLENNPSFGLVSGIVEYENAQNSGFTKISNGYKDYVNQINSWKSEDEIYQHIFIESPFAHPSVMFRKSLIDQFGLYSTEKIPEDYELWLRFFVNKVRMAKIDFPVIKWFDHSKRLSRTHPNYTKDSFDKIRLQYLKTHLDLINIRLPIYTIGDGKLAKRKIKRMLELGINIKGMVGFEKRDESFLPTISYQNIPKPGEIFFISLVSNRGKFEEVKVFLQNKNYEIGKDFILAS